MALLPVLNQQAALAHVITVFPAKAIFTNLFESSLEPVPTADMNLFWDEQFSFLSDNMDVRCPKETLILFFD